MKTAGFVWKYLKNFKLQFIIGLALSGVSVIFMLLLPQITQLFIDSVLDYSGADPDQISVFWIWNVEIFGSFTFSNLILAISLIFLICALLKNIVGFFSLQSIYNASSKTCGLLRSDCFKRLAKSSGFPLKYEIYVNFTNDISDLYSLIYTSYPLLFSSILKIFLVIVFLFFIDTGIAICLLIFILTMAFLGIISNKKTVKYFNNIRNNRSQMQKVAEEAVSEIREIKLFNREKYALQKYNLTGNNFLNSNIKGYGYLNKVLLLIDVLKVFAYALIVIIAAIKCFDKVLTIGFFVLILAYTWHAVSATQDLVKSIQDIGLRLVKISRTELFLKFRQIERKFEISPDSVLDIELKDVNVQLNERKLFNNLNLKLPYGKHYGILLGQGEGKSAFAKMLLSFYEIISGEILVAEKNINEHNILTLRNCFSYISQEPYIFEETLLNNIILFEELNEKKLESAIEICGLSSLIKKLPDGLEHKFSERGARISSQEKQKINMARAIYKNAPILLIDSAFNKFSKSFSQKIINEFKNFYHGRTIIMLSGRFSDVEFCDNLIYIKNGKVEESGNLATLKKNKKGFYYRYLRNSKKN